MWDGGTARQLGLVDGFGGMSEAIAKAAELAKLGDERSVRYLEPAPSFRDQFIETLATNDNDQAGPTDAFAMIARKPQDQLATILGEVRAILNGPSIQARCLECQTVAPVRPAQREQSLLALLQSWLAA